MPIYEYRCENGHTFEAFQSMADDALDKCEVCGAAAQRLLSAPAIHYKGSGFYTTDYARKGKKSTAGASGGSDSSGGGSDSGSKGGDGGSKGSGSDGGGSKDKASSGSSSGSSSSSSGS